jgi:hypothetical protein
MAFYGIISVQNKCDPKIWRLRDAHQAILAEKLLVIEYRFLGFNSPELAAEGRLLPKIFLDSLPKKRLI